MKLSAALAALLALPLLLVSCSSGDGGDLPKPGDSSKRAAPLVEFTICIVQPEAGNTNPAVPEILAGIEVGRAAIDAQTEAPRTLLWLEEKSGGGEQSIADALHRCLVAGSVATIAPIEPELAIPLIPVATASEAFLVVPQLGPGTIEPWGPTAVAVAPGPAEMGSVAGRDATARGHGEAAVLRVAGDFGGELGAAFGAAVVAGGGGVVADRELDPAANGDWLVAAREAAAAGATALFLVGPPEAAAAVAAGMGEAPLKGTDLWVIDWAMQPTVLSAATAEARGRIHGVFFPRPRGVFEVEYQSRFSEVPSPLAAVGYEAVMLAARAVRSAPSHQATDLVRALEASGDIQTAFGTGTVAAADGIVRLGSSRRVIYEARKDPADPEAWYFAPPE